MRVRIHVPGWAHRATLRRLRDAWSQPTDDGALRAAFDNARWFAHDIAVSLPPREVR